MPLQELKVAHNDAYDFGVGVDRLSGTTMNKVVVDTPSQVTMSGGSNQSFEVTRVRTTKDLMESLGIDVSASYGCAPFGAGVSARFGFASKSEVHSSALFMAVTCTIHLADLSIDECVLMPNAASLVDRPDIFAARYGNMFLRACKRGGMFVGVFRIETESASQSDDIEAALQGSYGFFSAEASVKFKKITAESRVSVYCQMYSQGGPALRIDDPTNPDELLRNANEWMTKMHEDGKRYSRPYEWTLSPLSIAEGPLPLNVAQTQRAEDVLRHCALARTNLLDQLNLLTWIRTRPGKFEWEGAVKPEVIAAAEVSTQEDLDTIADCASNAINNPAEAKMPARFARGSYPKSSLPDPLPKPNDPVEPVPVPPEIPPGFVKVPDWQRGDSVNAPSYGDNRAVYDANGEIIALGAYLPSAEEVGLVLNLQYVPPATGGIYMVGSVSPPAGTLVQLGSTVTVTAVPR